MMRALLKLLTMAALLFMPFGMGAATAAPAHGAAMAMTGTGHCGEPARDQAPRSSHSDCAMSCAAVPADKLHVSEPAQIASLPAAAPIPPALVGVHPDTATPPPKLS